MKVVKNRNNTVKTATNEIDNYKTEPTTVPTSEGPKHDPLSQYYGTDAISGSYRGQQSALEASKNASLQNAYISNEILKKYLPQQNKVNGLYGLGVSESAAIDAQNKYISNVGAIEQQHAENTAALLENYRQARQQEQDRIEQQQNQSYQEAMAMLESGAYTDAENIDNYLNTVKGTVSDAQYANLVQLANYYKSEAANEDSNELVAGTSKDVTFNNNGVIGASNFQEGDNFSVKLGDRILRVESRGEVTDEEKVNAAKDIGNNQVFAMGGKIYYKVNGKIYLIGGRGGNDASNHYSELYKHFYGGAKQSSDFGQTSDQTSDTPPFALSREGISYLLNYLKGAK